MATNEKNQWSQPTIFTTGVIKDRRTSLQSYPIKQYIATDKWETYKAIGSITLSDSAFDDLYTELLQVLTTSDIAVLDIFSYILENMDQWKKMKENANTSELQFFIPFYNVMTILFKKSLISMVVGEKQCVASKNVRQNNQVFAMGGGGDLKAVAAHQGDAKLT
ncbi:unnamed protein product [Absidia cylindrospora]